MYKIGYENTDKKILVDIYGIEFEVRKVSNNLLKDIENIREENIEDFKELYKYVDLFLGEGASEKINAKRKQDGYDEMNFQVIIAIIDLVINVYRNSYKEVMNYKNKFNNYNYGNRQNRRRR